jgi:proline iminopeptidase
MKQSLCLAAVFLFSALLLSCSPRQESSPLKEYFKAGGDPVQSGGIRMIPIQTPKGSFHVWTKRFGNNPRIKVLLLHGGPGATHEYFECFESYLPQEGIEFIYYDQLGSAYSDQPKDNNLWTTERFVEEVEQVRQALGLNKDNFYLLGHSWGGILAMEYALKYQQNLKGLIISNMMASIPEFNAYMRNILAKQVEPAVMKQLRTFEANKDFDDPEYLALMIPNFLTKHICRLKDWPEPVSRSLTKVNKEEHVLMLGPSAFEWSGRLVNWDRSADLKSISVSTLVIGAKYDAMDPDHLKMMSTQFQNGSYLYCPNGSHMDMWDDQQVYMSGLVNFLKGVDSGKKPSAH